MQEYTVEFRIHGRSLDIPSITEILGLEPSLTREVGDRRDQNTRWEEAMWAYDGFPQDYGGKYWNTLEEGLTFVLDKLCPIKSKIDALKSNYKVVFWCGQFQSSFGGGLILSPFILKRLGEFGVELFIDTHCIESNGEEASIENP